MANYSIYHPVPAMVQPMDWACWYTCYQMVVAYQRGVGRPGNLQDPSEVPWVQSIFTANRGVGTDDPEERGRVAAALGFDCHYESVTADGMADLLRGAPIIYDGQWAGHRNGHAVVIVGISVDDLIINNPATGMESYKYNNFIGQTLVQTRSRALVTPP